ncbi:carbohydrate-binding protein [Paenibacillus xylanexedens]|uniref:carbohydrate-binding protein n=1 Tax=Paenibacillus xylanexedens TaxID=528191 RepID=UPI0011A73C73|nr:carbohydrate-binding protein [Paenibacillus xylanexedens]
MNIFKKSLHALLITALIMPLAYLPAPEKVSAAGNTTINLSNEKQEIRGFGGMNHAVWAGDLTAAQRETAFGNGDNQLGLTVLRIPIDDNKNNWKKEVATAKRAIELGAIVFASPWNPPSDMTETFTLGASSGNGTTYQAETGTVLSNASVAKTNSGYLGSGYVQFQPVANASLQWNTIPIGSTGSKNIKVRYALASGTSNMDVYVNGSKVLSNVAFESTGSWTTWVEKSFQVSMANGTSTLKLVTTDSTSPIIDQMIITPFVQDTKAKRLKYDKYAAYAQYLNEFDTFMKNNGVNLYAISVQNEPDYAHDWTWWSPEEILRFMKENAGSINNKVIAPESFSYVKNMSDSILNDPEALANMDILGAHTYGTQFRDFPYPLFQEKGKDKELWMTEVYYPNSETNSSDRWPEALDVSYHIHNAMVEGNFQAYVWWYIRRHYSPINEDGTISKRGYNMAHFSKFIRPGYKRVEATKNPDSNVYVSAYKGDGKVVLVAINKGNSASIQTFSLQGGFAGSDVSSWVTDNNRNLEIQVPIQTTDNSFTTQLPAQSVTTFELNYSDNAPTPEVPSNGTLYESETGTSLIRTSVESTHAGYSGTGYIDFGALSDASVEWNNIFCAFAGTKKVAIRYALQSGSRNLDLFVNNEKVAENVSFPATGGWATWQELTVQVPMTSGMNSLKLVTTGTEGPNIDNITISAQ